MCAILCAAHAAEPEPRASFAGGPIQAIDLAAKHITILTTNGAASFLLAPNTYIFHGKEKLTADKLKVGDNIRLTWYRDANGQRLIRRIKFALPADTEAAP